MIRGGGGAGGSAAEAAACPTGTGTTAIGGASIESSGVGAARTISARGRRRGARPPSWAAALEQRSAVHAAKPANDPVTRLVIVACGETKEPLATEREF